MCVYYYQTLCTYMTLILSLVYIQCIVYVYVQHNVRMSVHVLCMHALPGKSFCTYIRMYLCSDSDIQGTYIHVCFARQIPLYICMHTHACDVTRLYKLETWMWHTIRGMHCHFVNVFNLSVWSQPSYLTIWLSQFPEMSGSQYPAILNSWSQCTAIYVWVSPHPLMCAGGIVMPWMVPPP